MASIYDLRNKRGGSEQTQRLAIEHFANLPCSLNDCASAPKTTIFEKVKSGR